MPEEIDTSITQEVLVQRLFASAISKPETPMMPMEMPLPNVAPKATKKQEAKKKQATKAEVKSANKGSMSTARILENQCRQLAMSVFFHETAPVRSIGFTSSIH